MCRATPAGPLGTRPILAASRSAPLRPFRRLTCRESERGSTLVRVVAHSQVQLPLDLIVIRLPTDAYVKSGAQEASPKRITVPALLVAFWH